MSEALKKSLSELESAADAMLKSGSGEQLSADNITDKKEPDEGGEKKDDSEKKPDEQITKGLAESEILNQKFIEIDASVNLLKGVVEKSVTTQDDSLNVFAKSFTAIAQAQMMMADMVKSIGGQLTEINGRMGNIEGQPQMRKSLANINVLNKDFQKSAGLHNKELNKSQIAAILSDELFKGNPNVTKHDIIALESGAPLRGELLTLINNRANQ